MICFLCAHFKTSTEKLIGGLKMRRPHTNIDALVSWWGWVISHAAGLIRPFETWTGRIVGLGQPSALFPLYPLKCSLSPSLSVPLSTFPPEPQHFWEQAREGGREWMGWDGMDGVCGGRGSSWHSLPCFSDHSYVSGDRRGAAMRVSGRLVIRQSPDVNCMLMKFTSTQWKAKMKCLPIVIALINKGGRRVDISKNRCIPVAIAHLPSKQNATRCIWQAWCKIVFKGVPIPYLTLHSNDRKILLKSSILLLSLTERTDFSSLQAQAVPGRKQVCTCY